MTLTYRWLGYPACALMVALGPVGCGSEQAGPPDSAGASPAVSRSGTSTPVSSPASRSVPPVSPPTARDGTNYRACTDGDCEIVVSEPITIPLSSSRVGAGPFKVEQVGVAKVRVSMTMPAGPSLSTTAEAGCTVAFYGNDDSGFAITRCTKEKLEDIPGMYVKQLVTVKSVTNRTAVLVLRSE